MKPVADNLLFSDFIKYLNVLHLKNILFGSQEFIFGFEDFLKKKKISLNRRGFPSKVEEKIFLNFEDFIFSVLNFKGILYLEEKGFLFLFSNSSTWKIEKNRSWGKGKGVNTWTGPMLKNFDYYDKIDKFKITFWCVKWSFSL